MDNSFKEMVSQVHIVIETCPESKIDEVCNKLGFSEYIDIISWFLLN